jgi:hypothetical protein
MCRAPILFKGIQKIQDSLEEKRWESAYSDAYSELFDIVIEYTRRMTDLDRRVYELHWSTSRREFFKDLLSQRSLKNLIEFEKMFALMKKNGEHPEHIGELIASGNYKRSLKKARREMWKTRECRIVN